MRRGELAGAGRGVAARPLESGPRTFLRRPGAADLAEFVALARQSRRLHRSFARPPDTPATYRGWLARGAEPSVELHLLCLKDSGAIAGVLNLSEIVRGPLQAANLGYYAFAPHAGKGYMREGVDLVLARAFLALGLHRVEANVQPSNLASLRLVLASGFRCEGYAPRLVYIAGRWRDHVRFAIDLESWQRRILGSRRRAAARRPAQKKRAP